MNEDKITIAKGVANLLVLVFLATTLLLFYVELVIEQVQCDNGEIIKRDWVNDGEDDCDDGSDESPAAEDWPSTTSNFWTSLILLVIFSFLSLKLGEKVKKFENDLRVDRLRKQRAQRRQAETAHLNYQREKASERERAFDYDSAIEIWEELGEKGEVGRVKKLLAHRREKARDYDAAINIYEGLGEIEEAARVRKLKSEQGAVKVAQSVVQGDQITKTDIRDSVISKSSIGAGGKSKSEELRDAKALLDDGVIDAAEFKQMKKEILGK